MAFKMLTRRHPYAADIRRKLDEGWRGPVLITWLYRLLDDREERVRRQEQTRGLSGAIPRVGASPD